jgi:hypothetical protein
MIIEEDIQKLISRDHTTLIGSNVHIFACEAILLNVKISVWNSIYFGIHDSVVDLDNSHRNLIEQELKEK